ncbi:MAG: SDR family NAD(P)-dependent oxidoreductase [Marinoscillum sp.]|uniref:SDR family NAD(P)-dependent oxidoreductase n=1 Tax=Marinoscillum sp. TaxID=2024838 RepID=UPI0033044D93
MSKNVLITGAAGNLGSAVSKKLISEGYSVIGTLVPGHKAPENGVDFYECDLTDERATQIFFQTIRTKYQKLDAVIMLVGGFAMGNIREVSSEDMMKMLTLNYFTAFHSAQNAIKWMNEATGGKLIFVGAKPAIEGGAGAVLPYAISKSAVIKLAEIINEDKNNKNIQASVIIPSIIDTPPNREGMPDANFDNWVKPEEIAENIAFLISEKANVLRGTVLKIYNNS